MLAEEFVSIAKSNTRFAFQLSGYSPPSLDPKSLQNAARVFLVYHYLSQRPLKPFYDNGTFQRLAQIEGVKLKHFNQAFRFDSRAIEELNDGFRPNPKNKLGSLYEHSRPGPGSFGTSFVSVSSSKGNKFNLAIGPVISSMKPLDLNVPQNQYQLKQLISELNDNLTIKGKVELLTTNEYEVGDFLGAIPKSEASIEGEKEIVVNYLRRDQFKRYRKVFVAVDIQRETWGEIASFKILGVSFTDWIEL